LRERTATLVLKRGPDLNKAAVRNFGQWAQAWSSLYRGGSERRPSGRKTEKIIKLKWFLSLRLKGFWLFKKSSPD